MAFLLPLLITMLLSVCIGWGKECEVAMVLKTSAYFLGVGSCAIGKLFVIVAWHGRRL